MSIEEFYNMTPRQFNNALSAYQVNQDNLQRLAFERARSASWMILAGQAAKNPVTITDLWPLPWDDNYGKEAQVNAEWGKDEAVLRRMQAVYEKTTKELKLGKQKI